MHQLKKDTNKPEDSYVMKEMMCDFNPFSKLLIVLNK